MAPKVESESFAAVGSHQATLQATIDIENEQVSYYFEYGTTSAYGSRTKAATTEITPDVVNVSAQVDGFAAGTEYHFRIVAKNEGGSEQGTDLTFNTLLANPVGLPDDRVYEMVTPVEKENAEVYDPWAVSYETQAEGLVTNKLFEASASGDALVYQAQATHNGQAMSEGPGREQGSAYLARHIAGGGWTQMSIQPPGRRITNYVGFSSDLSLGVLSSRTEDPEYSEFQLPGGHSPEAIFKGAYEIYEDLYRHPLIEESYMPLITAKPTRETSEFSGIYPDNGPDDDVVAPIYAGGTADLGQMLFGV